MFLKSGHICGFWPSEPSEIGCCLSLCCSRWQSSRAPPISKPVVSIFGSAQAGESWHRGCVTSVSFHRLDGLSHVAGLFCGKQFSWGGGSDSFFRLICYLFGKEQKSVKIAEWNLGNEESTQGVWYSLSIPSQCASCPFCVRAEKNLFFVHSLGFETVKQIKWGGPSHTTLF